MKQIFFTLLGVSLLAVPNCFAQVSIGSSTAPHASAALELTSTTKGLLLPRMTTAQRNAISTPAAGLMIYNTSLKLMETYTGGSWINDTSIGLTDVYSPTGQIWMDRNLGASQVATSSNDAAAYGDLYQWGRGADGHQISTSLTTTVQSDAPSDGLFIVGQNDWRTTPNDNLWQGVSGTNNPCPNGYRIPTDLEWYNEMATWPSLTATSAYNSCLKITLGGRRNYVSGTVESGSTAGANYWTSTVSGTTGNTIFKANYVYLNPTTAVPPGGNSNMRGYGMSVRCIKD